MKVSDFRCTKHKSAHTMRNGKDGLGHVQMRYMGGKSVGSRKYGVTKKVGIWQETIGGVYYTEDARICSGC